MPTSLEQLAAAAFHRAVSARLKAQGLRPSRSRVAGIVGTREQNYGAVLNGKRPVSMALIFTWIQAAEKELGAMVLTYKNGKISIGFEDVAVPVA